MALAVMLPIANAHRPTLIDSSVMNVGDDWGGEMEMDEEEEESTSVAEGKAQTETVVLKGETSDSNDDTSSSGGRSSVEPPTEKDGRGDKIAKDSDKEVINALMEELEK